MAIDEIEKGAPEDKKPGEPGHTDKDYVEIIQSNVDEIDPKYIKETGIPTGICYYCTDCEKLVQKPSRIGKKLRFKCPECKKTNVAFGSAKSITSYYKVEVPKETSPI